jgi:hypothetical protein
MTSNAEPTSTGLPVLPCVSNSKKGKRVLISNEKLQNKEVQLQFGLQKGPPPTPCARCTIRTQHSGHRPLITNAHHGHATHKAQESRAATRSSGPKAGSGPGASIGDRRGRPRGIFLTTGSGIKTQQSSLSRNPLPWKKKRKKEEGRVRVFFGGRAALLADSKAPPQTKKCNSDLDSEPRPPSRRFIRFFFFNCKIYSESAASSVIR